MAVAEVGEKKRGSAGKKNAITKPFRSNGWAPDWAARRIGAHSAPPNHVGAHMVRGAIGGILAAKLGYGMNVSPRLSNLIDRSLEQCPTGSRVFQNI